MAFARPTLLKGIAELSEAYDGFIIDLFGVVHNGETAFAGAVDCLARLKTRGKRVVLLSNSPRRKQEVSDHLVGIGITDALYDGLTTSGELVFEALSETEGGGRLQLGSRFECAGAIAARYEAIGGKAWYFGKPHQQAYEKAFGVLALPPSSVVCIGDGLNTDVLGANRSGIDAVLIVGGIHQSELRSNQDGHIEWERLDDLICTKHILASLQIRFPGEERRQPPESLFLSSLRDFPSMPGPLLGQPPEVSDEQNRRVDNS